MRLKLWEKSFLLTFAVFFALLNVCLVMWYLFDTRNDYLEFAEGCRDESENILYLERQISSGAMGADEVKEVAERYRERGVYIKLAAGGETLVDRTPQGFADDDTSRGFAGDDTPQGFARDDGNGYMGRVEVGGENYYYIHSGFNDCRLDYMKSMKGVYERYRNTALWVVLIDVILAVVVGALLYAAMRRIYKPVSDISHELRTPLTSVLGYAQYLSLEGVSSEERRTACQRIAAEAGYMKDMVERLLTVEALRGGSVKKERVELDEIVEELRGRYPGAIFENRIEHVMGDKTLVRMLLSNLMENAVREDAAAQLVAKGQVIEIRNRTERLDDGDVRRMNLGEKPADEKVRGSGLGIELCMEIAGRHGWRLRYRLEEGRLCARVQLSL